MSTPQRTYTEQALFNALKVQLLSVFRTLPLTRLKSMLRQAQLIAPSPFLNAEALAGLLSETLLQAHNSVQDHGPDDMADHYHMVFVTEWESAEAKYKATNHTPLEMICEHWYLTGRIHEASAIMNAPDIPHANPRDMHPFAPGFDDVCTVCDKREKEGNHGSDKAIDYSADADPAGVYVHTPAWEPTADQLRRLREASERTTE